MSNPKYEIQIIGGESVYFSFRPNGIEVFDNSKSPWTAQPSGRGTVYLLKDMIDRLQQLVDKYGDQVGYTNHHCGMGNYCEEFVILRELNYNFDPGI